MKAFEQFQPAPAVAPGENRLLTSEKAAEMDQPQRPPQETPLKGVRTNIVQSIRAFHVHDLQDAAAQAAGAGVACETLHVAEGYPSEALVKAATEHGAGLLVMASHGRRGLGRVLLGSQTQAVLAHSTVPVLVVR